MRAPFALPLAALAVAATAASAQTPVPPPAAAPAQAPTGPAADCDRLAAHPLDPDRRAAAGVMMEAIDPAAALAACEAATAAEPAAARLWFQWARALEAAGRDADAAERYRRAAQFGSVAAMSNLGLMLMEGRGVATDVPAGIEWIRRAAERAYPPAQVSLGSLHEDGRFLQRSDAEAARWYRSAADAGDPSGQNAIAWMLEQGRGVARDEAEAERYYRLAAEQNYAEALNNLAWFLNARGREPEEARAFATRAFEAQPDNPAFADTLAAVLIDQGYPAEALPLAQFAAEQEPGNAEYHERRGDALWGIERGADARAAWQRALELATSDTQRRRLQQKIERQ
ncbi:MAG: tetratricopeptide repeat protein [Alphaproteobacteria bacterium]|nr:tetratricopeptide repeat protein [Alphaproteobacteria bacterium]